MKTYLIILSMLLSSLFTSEKPFNNESSYQTVYNYQSSFNGKNISGGNKVTTVLSGNNNSAGYLSDDPVSIEAKFYQMDYVFYDSAQINSDWGSLELIFDDFDGVKLLNLSVIAPGVDSVWQIRNVPVVSTWSIRDTQYFKFDIGTAGIDVNSITYGISLTDWMMYDAPPAYMYEYVSTMPEIHTDQINDAGHLSGGTFFPPAVPFVGISSMTGLVTSTEAKNKNFPRFEPAFMNASVESAVSNSLHYLKETHALFIHDTLISPEKLHSKLIDSTGKIAANWVEKKDAYMKEANTGITTRFLRHDTITKILDKVMNTELPNHQDVEMVTKNKNGVYEVVPVTSIVKDSSEYKSGNKTYKPTYIITSNKDSKPLTYDPDGKDIKPEVKKFLAKEKYISNGGAAYKDHNKFENSTDSIVGFVVECPGADQWNTSPVNPSNNSVSVSPYPMTISWNPHPVENSYWLEVAADPDFQQKVIDSTHLTHPFMNTVPNMLMPNTTYFWRVRANDSVGPGRYDTIYTFTTASAQTLNLSAYIQGFYNNVSNSMTADTARVYLREMNPPFALIDSAKGILNSGGQGTFSFYNALNEVSYFIVLKHRNSIETWSMMPVLFSSGNIYYDFTAAPGMAFGSNMALIDPSPLRYGIYSGDINQEGHIDLVDVLSAYNNARTFTSGYKITDLSGDNLTDLSDVLIAYNNAVKFIGVIRP